MPWLGAQISTATAGRVVVTLSDLGYVLNSAIGRAVVGGLIGFGVGSVG